MRQVAAAAGLPVHRRALAQCGSRPCTPGAGVVAESTDPDAVIASSSRADSLARGWPAVGGEEQPARPVLACDGAMQPLGPANAPETHRPRSIFFRPTVTFSLDCPAACQ